MSRPELLRNPNRVCNLTHPFEKPTHCEKAAGKALPLHVFDFLFRLSWRGDAIPHLDAADELVTTLVRDIDIVFL